MATALPAFLRANRARIQSLIACSQSIGYDREKWAAHLDKFPAWDAFCHAFPPDCIARLDIQRFFQSKSKPLAAGFIATMVWGYGPVGYGPWRTACGMARQGFNSHLEQIFHLVRGGRVKSAYVAINIPKMGPAFFTKLFYFMGTYPLILDSVVLNALEGKCGLDPRQYGRFSRNAQGRITASQPHVEGYLAYLGDLHAWAEQMQCQADQIELFLFQQGR